MTPLIHAANRRRFLSRMAWTAACAATPGLFAETLLQTPRQTEGPFYPDKLPLDTDNDLLIINDSTTPAVGEVTWLSGRILDSRGEPIRNATVEIWQCDRNGVYLHSKGGDRARIDAHFQGFGRFVTGATGEYLFRTIKPVPYTGRTPHIHFAVKVPRREKFTTQCYVRGEPQNETDSIWKRLEDPRVRDAVTPEFKPLPNSAAGELAARFDIVLGFTPEA